MAGRFSVETVFRGIDKFTAPVSRMQNRVSKFTRAVSSGLKKANRAVDKFTSSVIAGGKAVVARTAVLGAALLGTVTLFNQASVEAEQLARAVGFNVDKLEALAGAVKPAGFELDNVVDLIEEMNNKLGESAALEQITPVKEALQILGLEFKNIQRLAPEDQFTAIADAALKMEDAQKAAAAADILLGGEANKIIGVLRQQGRTLDEVIDKQQKLNFRTQKSREGALAFTRQLGLATRGATSLGAEISGLIGGQLAPLFEKLTQWAAANKELIAQRVTESIESIVGAVQSLVTNIEDVTKWLKRFGTGLAVFLAFSAVLKTLIGIMTLVNLVMAANPIGLIVIGVTALIAAFTALIVWIDEINDRFDHMPGFAKALLAPLMLVIKAIKFIKDNAGVITGAIGRVGQFLGLSSGDDERQVSEAAAAAVVSPQDRVARQIEESRTTSTSEVVIKDETGRAEATGGKLGAGLQLQSTGAF